MNIDQLKFKKYPVLDQGFICLVDVMGDDSSIVQAARVSYDKDVQETCGPDWCKRCNGSRELITDRDGKEWPGDSDVEPAGGGSVGVCPCVDKLPSKDKALIRYLMSHNHTTPFEMVEIKFMVQAPMDCWRQWIRHRTANVNEYSTRYTEAIDMCQTTAPDQWRLQATDNKQGSSGNLYGWPKNFKVEYVHDSNYSTGYLYTVCSPDGERIVSSPNVIEPTEYLCTLETEHHEASKWVYDLRLKLGIAKEQARKDLPLSTYTRAYWKCDLHNIFNFLRLRMDSHAQYEIRMYANAMYEIVKQIVPVACEAFEDYVLNAKRFSAMEMNIIRHYIQEQGEEQIDLAFEGSKATAREIAEFKKKVGM